MIRKRKYTKTFIKKMEKDLLRGGPDGGKMTYQQVADKYNVPVGSVGGTISWLRKLRREAKTARKQEVATEGSKVDSSLDALDKAFNVLRDATMDFIEDSAKPILNENRTLKRKNEHLVTENKKLITFVNTKTLENKGWRERAKKAFGNYE